MLKLKLQYFDHLIHRADSLKKNPNAGKHWGQEGKAGLNGHEFEQTLGDREGQGTCQAAAHGVAKNWIRLSNWATTTVTQKNKMLRCKYRKTWVGFLCWKLQNTSKKRSKDLNKWRNILFLWVGRINILKMTILPDLIYKVNVTAIQIPVRFL